MSCPKCFSCHWISYCTWIHLTLFKWNNFHLAMKWPAVFCNVSLLVIILLYVCQHNFLFTCMHLYICFYTKLLTKEEQKSFVKEPIIYVWFNARFFRQLDQFQWETPTYCGLWKLLCFIRQYNTHMTLNNYAISLLYS